MKTCLACGRQSGNGESQCVHCGARLPAKPEAPPETLAQIDFLLSQLDSWVANNTIGPEQAYRLRGEYLDRKDRLESREALRPTLPPPAPPAPRPSLTNPQAGSRPVVTTVNSSRNVASASPAYQSQVSSGIGEAGLSYWQAVGFALLFAGLVGMVGWAWNRHVMGGVVATLVALNVALFAALRAPAIASQPVTRGSATIAALLLIPLEVVAASRMVMHPWHAGVVGVVASLACFAASAVVSRFIQSRCVTATFAASIAGAAIFGSGLVLAKLFHAHGYALGRAETAVYFVIAAVYFVVAAAVKDDGHRRIWLGFAHAAAVLALLLALVTATTWGVIGPAALALAIGGTAYMVGSALFRSTRLATVSLVLTLGAVELGLVWAKVSVFSGWWWHAIAINSVALALLGFSRIAARMGFGDFEKHLATLSQLASALSLVPQIGVVLACISSLGDPKLVPSHVWGALVAAFMTLVVLRPIARPAMTTIWIAYLGILLEFLLSCYAPKGTFLHSQPNIGLALAGTAAYFQYGAKQRDQARWCFIAALAVAAIYALEGGFAASTMLALGAVVALIAADVIVITSKRRGALDLTDSVVASAALTILMLLFEGVALPYFHARYGWDRNAGYGLIPLALIFAALSGWLRREQRVLAPVMRTTAATVVLVTVVLQFNYELHDGMLRSPMLVLEAGILVCGLVAIFARSETSAWVTIALNLAAVLLLTLSPHPFYSPRETTLVWTTLGSAIVFVILAVREKRQAWTYAASLFLLAALLGIVHRWTGLSTPGYMILVGLYDFALLATALGLRSRDELDSWCTPAATVAIVLSYALVPPLISLFSSYPSASAFRVDTAAMVVTSLVFGALALVYRRESYVMTASLVLTALWLFVARHIDPASQTTKLAVDVSYAAIVLLALGWLGIGPAGPASASPVRFILTGLMKAAVCAAVLSLIMGLAGVSDGPGRYTIYSALLMGLVFMGVGSALWNSLLELFGKVSFGLAFFIFALIRIQAPGVPISDWYLVGAGAFSLVIAALGGYARPQSANAGLISGALLMMAIPLAAIWAPHPSAVLAPIVAVECVVFVYWGLAGRVIWLTITGSIVLGTLIALAAAGHTPRVHWAVFAVLLGVVVIASAMMIERRKSRVSMAGTDSAV